jgi:carboxypeptidase PM20D1
MGSRRSTGRLARRAALVLLLLAGLLAAAVALRTLTLPSRQLAPPRVQPVAHDVDAAAGRLAEAVRLRTVSTSADAAPPRDALLALHDLLARHYPAAHAAMRRETVNELTLLYTWEGTDPQARPIVLMAHQDVAPIAPGTEGDWTMPPFSGALRDGFVWGRGTWDDKGNLIAMMEAVEALASAGFAPRRTVILLFGHDEEVGGERGAAAAAQLLRARGVRAEFVLDEGLLVTEGILPGLATPAALIGVAEKGFLTLELEARAATGHGSMPPARNAIGTLVQALARVQARPLPATLNPLAREMLDTLAPEMHGVTRVALSNLWLTAPLVMRQFEGGASTNALLRTTTAPVVLAAGEKFNVLPARASAVLHFRLRPGDTVDAVQRHVEAAVADPDIRIQRRETWADPTRVSRTDTIGYRAIARSMRELHPDIVVAPGLYLAVSDSRHLEPIAEQVYRFSPVRAGPSDLSRLHGTDERLSVSNLGEMIQFYRRLLVNAAGAEGQ